MVMPGATSKKASVNIFDCGRRALLIACHAISIAMTVVLPAPVASFRARRNRPGFEPSLCCRKYSRCLAWTGFFGATSVNQISVSAASTWQKNSGRSRSVARQCFSKRAVSYVTPQLASGELRHWSTSARMALTRSFARRSDARSSRISSCWPPLARFEVATATMYSDRRRPSFFSPVGIPSSESAQCRSGLENGRLRMGFSIAIMGVVRASDTSADKRLDVSANRLYLAKSVGNLQIGQRGFEKLVSSSLRVQRCYDMYSR